jgi:hypothetical protein
LHLLRSSSQSQMTPGPGLPHLCDSLTSSLAEFSMTDMAGPGLGQGSPSAAAAAARSQQTGSRNSLVQQKKQQEGPTLQLRAEPDRGAAGLPSSRFYGRLGVRGSSDKERHLAPTGFL